jgi:hypothetical protein
MMLYEQLKLMIEAMKDLIPQGSNTPARGPTAMKKVRPIFRQNHGQGESKSRRKMAAASNRINRRRVKRWKY